MSYGKNSIDWLYEAVDQFIYGAAFNTEEFFRTDRNQL